MPDSNGGVGVATATVTVFALPTASVDVTSETPQVGVPVTFELSASTPSNTVLTSYALNVTGPDLLTRTATTAPPSTLNLVFAKAGMYTVDFNVRNDAGASVNAKPLVLEVLVDQTPPKPALLIDGSSGLTLLTMGTEATFDGTTSAAAAGHTLASAVLDFGDGSAVVHLGADPSKWRAEPRTRAPGRTLRR